VAGQNPATIFIQTKIKRMYSLKCSYYTKQFSSIDELVNDVISSGMDPNYEVTLDGRNMGFDIINYIQF
jgi:hypothetical protein